MLALGSNERALLKGRPISVPWFWMSAIEDRGRGHLLISRMFGVSYATSCAMCVGTGKNK
jgi:hypothetical protein